MKKFFAALFVSLLSISTVYASDDIACSNTNGIILSDKVCVTAIKDQDVDGMVCHISYAKKGGLKGMVGIAEDPSRFSIACRQVGQLKFNKSISVGKTEEVASFKRSMFFKESHVMRVFDKENNTLVYYMYSDHYSSCSLGGFGTTN